MAAIPPIGTHVSSVNPLGEARIRRAEVVQMFLGNPQSWRKPPPRPDAAELRESGLLIYVHANYLINVASPNNRIRIPSRKNLAQAAEAARAIGAAGLVVHGGHVGDDEDVGTGAQRWRKALEGVEDGPTILIENTAGGGNAVARRVETIGRLWEGIGDPGVGFCLDTCHAWSAGEDLVTLVERILGATGRIDLVHCNDSRDLFGSGRDRHANLGHGEIPSELLVEVARAAGAAVVVETPDDDGSQAADIAWLRQQLSRPGPGLGR